MINVVDNDTTTNINYLDGTDNDFIAYLGNDAIEEAISDFADGKSSEQVVQELEKTYNFQLNNVSENALVQTLDYCKSNIIEMIQIYSKEGDIGVAVEIINLIPDVSTATPINN